MLLCLLLVVVIPCALGDDTAPAGNNSSGNRTQLGPSGMPLCEVCIFFSSESGCGNIGVGVGAGVVFSAHPPPATVLPAFGCTSQLECNLCVV